MLFHNSDPYKADGTIIFLYKLVDVNGLSPRGCTPSPSIAKNAALAFCHLSDIRLLIFKFESCRIPR